MSFEPKIRDEATAWRLLKTTGSPKAKQWLVDKWRPLAIKLSHEVRVAGVNIDSEDRISEAILGLLRAIDYFDPDNGTSFQTYAWHCIHGHLLRVHRQRMPGKRNASEDRPKLRKAEGDLEEELGRPPSEQEVMDRLGWTRGHYDCVVRLPAAEAVLFSQVGSEEPAEGLTDVPCDWASAEFEDVAAIDFVSRLLSRVCSDRQREVLNLRFIHGLAGADIARMWNMTIQAVYSLEKAGLRNIRPLLVARLKELDRCSAV